MKTQTRARLKLVGVFMIFVGPLALAYLLYTELPDLWTWVGAGIIAASAIYIGQREAKLARERERAVLRAASTSPGSRDV